LSQSWILRESPPHQPHQGVPTYPLSTWPATMTAPLQLTAPQTDMAGTHPNQPRIHIDPTANDDDQEEPHLKRMRPK